MIKRLFKSGLVIVLLAASMVGCVERKPYEMTTPPLSMERESNNIKGDEEQEEMLIKSNDYQAEVYRDYIEGKEGLNEVQKEEAIAKVKDLKSYLKNEDIDEPTRFLISCRIKSIQMLLNNDIEGCKKLAKDIASYEFAYKW